MDSKAQEGLVGGRYRILTRVRSDRQVVTFRAEDTRSGEVVALLVFLTPAAGPEAAGVFHRVMQRWAALKHPTVPAVLDMGNDRGVDYVAVERPGNIFLPQLVQKSGGLSVPRVVDIGMQLCVCFSALRQAGISPAGLSVEDLALDARGNLRVSPSALAIQAQTDPVGTPQLDATQAAAMIRGLVGTDMSVAPELVEILQEGNYLEPITLANALAGYWRTRWQTLPDRPALSSIAPQKTPPPARTAATTVPHARQGWDKPGIALLILTVAAILGMIPLWASVYSKYSRPVALAPTVSTPIPNTAVVPDLTGLDEATGRDLLVQAGLRLEVIGQEYSTLIPLGKVMTQEPRGGQRAPQGSAVYVVLSKGAVNAIVPDVVGQSYTAAEALLAQSNLNASRQDVWSESASDSVLTQDPAAGSQVTPGTTISLRVSSGSTMTLNATLGDLARLLTAQADKGALRPGETLQITLRWQALRSVESRYSVFVHLIGPTGEIVSQDDAEPVRGNRPTSGWTAGDVITDPHSLVLPPNAPAGEYQVRVGLYLPGPNERLPVIDAGRADVQDNALTIHRIKVNP